MVVANEICHSCGKKTQFIIADDAVTLREAVCCQCGALLKNSDVLAKIIEFVGAQVDTVKGHPEIFNKYSILNTSASGFIHEALRNYENYYCSEFFEDVESGQYKENVLCVNLCEIPFSANTFDIIITEDVLEHINDTNMAFKEIYRVLKEGGSHIFTVPLHEGRNTVNRTENENKVYHEDPIRGEDGCLVANDFGDDIANILEGYGYNTEIDKKHVFYLPDQITDVDKSYEEYLQKVSVMHKYFKYNSVVIQAVKRNVNQPDTEFTGERFVPGIEDISLELEHYQRYISVLPVVEGKVVLDAACGEGYGTSILGRSAKNVVGIDISQEAIERAKKKYNANDGNISFMQSSVEKLPLENGSVDVVVSFETIEHVPQDVQVGFLAEISRILSPTGLLIMSTPNKAIYSDLYDYHNEYHIKEFYKKEFLDFLHTKFQNITLYNQYFEVVSIIDRVDDDDANVLYKKDRSAYTQEGKYFIAIASNGLVHETLISSVFMNKVTEFEQKVRRIIQLQNEEKIRNEHIIHLDKQIAEKNTHIAQLIEQVDKNNIDITRLREEYVKRFEDKERGLATREESLKAREESLKAREESLKAREESLKAREASLKIREEIINKEEKNLSERNDYITKIKSDLKELEERLHEASQEIILRGKHILKLDKEIAFLRERYAMYEQIINSRGYRMAGKVRSFGVKLFPKGSRRRFILSTLLKGIRHPFRMIRLIKWSRVKNMFKILRANGLKDVAENFYRVEATDELLRNPGEKVSLEEVLKHETISDYDIIRFNRFENPLVTIIIPVYNQFEYTYNCLKSVFDNSSGIAYEIIIADDGSKDFTIGMEQVVVNITRIAHKENLRFLKNCNNAAKSAKGKYILFLNNDTQVQKNWLSSMLELVEKDDSIGIVGSKLVYSNGLLQEAGGIIWKDGSAWNYGSRKSADDADFNYVKEVDFISGASIMIRKDVWEKAGGFDERFAPAYYEDVDLAFTVRSLGYRVVYQPASVVVHFEGISNGTDLESGQKAYQVVNQNKFLEKWMNTLEKEHFVSGDNVFFAKDRSRFKKHILIIDHYVPHFDQDAGGRGTFMYLQMFVNLGMQVTFVGDNFFKHEPYTSILNQMGIEVLYGKNYMDGWKRWLKDNGNNFDYIYLQRPHIAMKYMDDVKRLSNAKVIYYDVDLHHVRELRQYEVTKDPDLLVSAEKWKKIEFDLFEKADVIHVVGSYEQQYLHQFFPDKPIRNIPLYIYDKPKDDANDDFSARNDLLFVGGFGHPPNEDAVLWFAECIFPQIKAAYPEIKWYIVGAKPSEKTIALGDENIKIKGFVSDEELAELYCKCKISVVPLRYGAGIKGKVLEAIYNQVPLITTSIGAEGLSRDEDAFWVEDDADRMADLIIKLYKDNDELIKKTKNSSKFITSYFTLEEAERIIHLDIDTEGKKE